MCKIFVITIPSNFSMIYYVLYLVLVLSLTYLYKEDLQVYVSNVAVYSLLEIDAFQKISLAKAPINDKIPYLTSGIYTEWGRPFLYFYWYAIMMLSKVPQGYVINITVNFVAKISACFGSYFKSLNRINKHEKIIVQYHV